MNIITLIIVMGACNHHKESDHIAVFESFWDTFNETYPYFELKNVDWDLTYELYKEKVASSVTDAELQDLLISMVAPLKDNHIQIKTDIGFYKYSDRALYASNSSENAYRYYQDTIYHNQRVLYTIIQDEVAYLQVSDFSGSVNNYTDFPVETIISSIAKQKGVIIDLRDNGGGKELFATDFASRFMPDGRTYKHTREREGAGFGEWEESIILPWEAIPFENPIVLLMNRGCYSAAEGFVLMMKTLDHTIAIGDTTGGTSGNPIQRMLPNGWTFTLPSRQVVSTDFQYIEDHGIAPDIVLPMSDESIAEGRDLMIEKALDIIQQ